MFLRYRNKVIILQMGSHHEWKFACIGTDVFV